MMAKYRKKPIVVEAEQFFPDKTPWPKGVRLGGGHALDFYVITIHGQFTPIVAGDWIIPEPPGDYVGDRAYPCKPDIFEATYEKVET